MMTVDDDADMIGETKFDRRPSACRRRSASLLALRRKACLR